MKINMLKLAETALILRSIATKIAAVSMRVAPITRQNYSVLAFNMAQTEINSLNTIKPCDEENVKKYLGVSLTHMQQKTSRRLQRAIDIWENEQKEER